MSGGAFENREISLRDQEALFHELEGEISEQQDQSPESPWSYVIKRGKKPIALTGVEWRILKLLASRPYHAFTPRYIADAVTTDSQPVTADSLRTHISSLRDKLGFFADYVQTVPYIGYRFRE
ncbi:MAG: helix-turn-helix domain-containing protein [Planctomycetaceae bacterium]|nr:MAG: helix-turn-helix domain-containing protein [Planctomycetaceae bacterium]